MRTPETQSASLGVKREIASGLAVSADAVYSRGYHQCNTRDLNPLNPGDAPAAGSELSPHHAVRDRGPLVVPGGVGNLGRNTNIGPAYVTFDMRVSKFFQLSRLRLETFLEAFNATDHVNFGTTQGNLRSASFGQSTAIQGPPRQVEIGFRLDF
jgi:hypothetical protein